MRADVGATGARVRVAGVDIAYDDGGPKNAKMTLVCTHAIGHGARDFEPLRAHLGQDHRVVAFDWPGQGRSGLDGAPPSSARYAEILGAFLRELAIERPVLVGNSIGGAAAFELVAKQPEIARALVIANLGGLFPRNAMSHVVTRSFAQFFEAGARGAWWYPRAFAAYYRMVLQRPAAHAQRARIVASAREIAPVLAAAWRGFGQASSDLRLLAPEVRVPVLVAWAMGDVFNPLWASLGAIRRIPSVRIVKMRAGHNPFLECADEAAAAVQAFEAELPS